MSRATSGTDRQHTPEIADVTELEERAIWQRDVFYCRPRSNRGKIHLWEDCQRLKTDPVEKNTSVYPRGYRDVCLYCIKRFRQQDDG